MTEPQIIELIQRDYNANLPFDDASVTDNEVKLLLRQALAAVIEEKYRKEQEVDGVAYMNDAFYVTYKNRVVSRDADTGYYYCSLPHPPIGLPRGVAIAGVYFKSAEGQLTETVIIISPQEIDVMRGLPKPKNRIYGWAEGASFYMDSYKNIKGLNAVVRMVASAPQSNTYEIPDAVGMAAMDLVIRRLRTRNNPQDISNDGSDIK